MAKGVNVCFLKPFFFFLSLWGSWYNICMEGGKKKAEQRITLKRNFLPDLCLTADSSYELAEYFHSTFQEAGVSGPEIAS